jgi:hypothetical protein
VSRIVKRLGVLVSVILIVGLLPATSANAVGGFSITGATAGINLRSGPGTAYSVVGHVANHTPIDIACQGKGSLVGVGLPGTPTDVWDHLTSGGWVADFYTTTPGLAGSFTPGIPRCGVLQSPPAPPTAPSPLPVAVDCSKTLFIGLRGSGAPVGDHGMGNADSPVDQTFVSLARRGARLDIVDPNAQKGYPASAVSLILQNPKQYYDSVNKGTALALAALHQRTNSSACGWQRTRTILVGYSQGALALSNAVFQMTPEERSTIVGIVFYGNPAYTPWANGAAGPSYFSAGITGPRPAWANGVGARTRDYCRNGDPVCASWGLDTNTLLSRLLSCLSSCQHYLYGNGQVGQGISYLAARPGVLR